MTDSLCLPVGDGFTDDVVMELLWYVRCHVTRPPRDGEVVCHALDGHPERHHALCGRNCNNRSQDVIFSCMYPTLTEWEP